MLKHDAAETAAAAAAAAAVTSCKTISLALLRSRAWDNNNTYTRDDPS